MPKPEERYFNPALFELARVMVANYLSNDIPGVTQVIMPRQAIEEQYIHLVKVLKMKFKKFGVPFDENQFFKTGSGPNSIHLRFSKGLLSISKTSTS